MLQALLAPGPPAGGTAPARSPGKELASPADAAAAQAARGAPRRVLSRTQDRGATGARAPAAADVGLADGPDYPPGFEPNAGGHEDLLAAAAAHRPSPTLDEGCLAEVESSSVEAPATAQHQHQHPPGFARPRRRGSAKGAPRGGSTLRCSMDNCDAVLSHGAPGMPGHAELREWQASALAPGASASEAAVDAGTAGRGNGGGRKPQRGGQRHRQSADVPPGL